MWFLPHTGYSHTPCPGEGKQPAPRRCGARTCPIAPDQKTLKPSSAPPTGPGTLIGKEHTRQRGSCLLQVQSSRDQRGNFMLPGHTAFSFAMSINRRFYEEEGKNIPRAVSAPQKERDVFNTCAARSGADSHSARRLQDRDAVPWLPLNHCHLRPSQGRGPTRQQVSQ